MIIENEEQYLAVAFIDNINLVEDSPNAEENMKNMMKEHEELHNASRGLIEIKKTKYYSWKWTQR